MKFTFVLFISIAIICSCNAQTFTDQATYTVDVRKIDKLRLHNIYGPVKVMGTSGNQAKITVSRKLHSASSQQLEDAKQKIYLDSIFVDNSLIFFVEAPDRKLKIDEDGFAYYQSDWDRERNKNYLKIFDVKYEFSIEMQVPAQKDLHVSTHHEDLEVNGMNSNIVVQNHHDDLLVKNVGGNATVRNHHGDITVYYTKNPTQDCSYKTHHGTVKVHYKDPLSVDVAMKSYHGEFFTDFDWVANPVRVTESTSSKGTKYVMGKGTSVKIGSGGPEQVFKTHHGDIYLLKH